MTHLKIEQNTGLTEEVVSSVIAKLYDIVHAGGLDASSNLKGRLHTTATYLDYITYLQGLFDGTNNKGPLYIDATKKYCSFADPEARRWFSTYWGDGTGVTAEQMATHTNLYVVNWTLDALVTLDELGQFPSIIRLDTYLFSNRLRNLLSIDLSNIQYIGGEALQGCTSLTGVINLPSVVQIGDNTRGSSFASCTGITEVNCGPNFIELYSTSFYNCQSLQRVTGFGNINNTDSTNNRYHVLPNGVFENCTNLISTDIDYSYFVDVWATAFKNCTNLEDSIDLTSFTSVNSDSFSNCSKIDFSGTIENIVNRGQGSFYGCDLSNVTVTINCNSTAGNTQACFSYATLPSTVTLGQDVTFIAIKEFNNATGLKNIVGGSNVTTICDYAFSHTPIESISLNSVTSIGKEGFTQCRSLTTASFTALETVGSNVFSDCSNLSTLSVTGLKSIGYKAFLKCSALTSVNISSSVTDIQMYAFEGCSNLTSLGTTNFTSITELHARCFYGCSSLTGELSFPSLTTLTFESGQRGLQFYGCTGLTKLSFGHLGELNHGYTTSYPGPFGGCTNLKIVDLGDSLTTISPYNFYNCTSLRAVIINNTTPPAKTGNTNASTLDPYFGNTNVNVYVPDAAVSTYQSTVPYSNFADHIKPLSLYNESAILAS